LCRQIYTKVVAEAAPGVRGSLLRTWTWEWIAVENSIEWWDEGIAFGEMRRVGEKCNLERGTCQKETNNEILWIE